MTAYSKTTGQETGKKGFLNRLRQMSRRNQIIGVALLVLLVLLVISIPGDQSQLRARQQEVESAQVAYDLAFPPVEPMLASVLAGIDDTGLDLAGNRSYTGLSTA